MTLAIAASVFAPATGLAQQTDLGFTIGFYDPVGSLVERGVRGDTSFFQQRLQSTPTLGASVTVWTSPHLGVAGNINLSPSDVAVTDSTGTHDHSSTVLLASVRVLYAFTPMLFKPRPGKRELPWSYYVGAGLGVANRSGGVWAYSSGLTSPALLLNAGVRTAVGSRAVLRFDLEDYLSRAQFNKGLATETAARMHHDFILGLSLSYRVAR